MKQVVLNIPDNKYLAFINHVRSKFADIQIKEKNPKAKEDVTEEDSAYETMLLSSSV